MKMKTLVLSILITAFCVATAGAEEGKLHLYTWDTYVAPALFKEFEKETGIEVITDIYSSNDALMAKIKAGAAYDVVAPSGNHVPFLAAEKLLQPLPEDIRALGANLSPSVQKPEYDPDYTYSLPLFYGTTGLAVDTKLTGESITSWHQFFSRPDGEKPSLGVLDEVPTVMNIGLLSLYKPLCDNTPASYKALQALLSQQKPFVKVYGATGYSERIAAHEIALQMAWNGDVYKARQQNQSLKYVYPKEGVELWVDNFAIPASAKNTEGAKKFISFMMRPENAAAYAVAAGMMPALKAAHGLLPKEMKEAPEFNIPDGIPVGVARSCPADVMKAYDQIWSKLVR